MPPDAGLSFIFANAAILEVCMWSYDGAFKALDDAEKVTAWLRAGNDGFLKDSLLSARIGLEMSQCATFESDRRGLLRLVLDDAQYIMDYSQTFDEGERLKVEVLDILNGDK